MTWILIKHSTGMSAVEMLSCKKCAWPLQTQLNKALVGNSLFISVMMRSNLPKEESDNNAFYCIFQYHCWKCGDVFCTRCIDRLMPLPGHNTQTPVPVCKACYKELKSSPSSSIQVTMTTVTMDHTQQKLRDIPFWITDKHFSSADSFWP